MRELIALGLVCLFALSTSALAAPMNGQVRALEQPDGSRIEVRAFGDEIFTRLEGLDGYTVVRDPTTGYYCYAERSPDGQELRSTGRAYGTRQPPANRMERFWELFGVAPSMPPLPSEKRLQLPADVLQRERDARRRQLRRSGTVPAVSSNVNEMAPRARSCGAPTDVVPHALTGPVVGLTILMDFPDRKASDTPGTPSVQDVDPYLNDLGYTGGGNNGSVRSYFRDVSGGKLDYTNLIVGYYRARHDTTHYADPAIPYGVRASEFVIEALEAARQGGFDFSRLTVDGAGCILAVNVFHVGLPIGGPNQGLWAHQDWIDQPFSANGVEVGAYQVSDMGNTLTLGTFCHESGHMLFNWPDLYDLKKPDSCGTGMFDIMSDCTSYPDNPVPPNPWLRHTAGWDDVHDLRAVRPGATASHVPNSNTSFRWARGGQQEFYYVESRATSGRNANLPASGLLVWHVDPRGSNDLEDMTPDRHYKVSVVQADNQAHLEKYDNCGDEYDTFADSTGSKVNRLTDRTAPSSRWWDGTSSGLRIDRISDPGPTVTFRRAP